MLIASTRDFYRANHVQEIEKELLTLQQEVDRLQERMQRAQKSYEALGNHLDNASISAQKIDTKLDKMNNGKDTWND